LRSTNCATPTFPDWQALRAVRHRLCRRPYPAPDSTAFKKRGRDLGFIDELLDLDGSGFFRCRFLQLIIRNDHEIVPFDFEAADDLVGRHFFAGGFRDALIANFGMILLVQKVRADGALAFSGGV
jgi:hypothetical protein